LQDIYEKQSILNLKIVVNVQELMKLLMVLVENQ
jgi:hypothetical protein